MQRTNTAYKRHAEMEKLVKLTSHQQSQESKTEYVFEDVCKYLLSTEDAGAKNLQVFEGTILVNNIFTGKTSNSGETACSTLLRNTKSTGEILPDGKHRLVVVDAKANFYGNVCTQFQRMIDNLPKDCTKIRIRIVGENMNRQVREADNRIALEMRVLSFAVKKRYPAKSSAEVETVKG